MLNAWTFFCPLQLTVLPDGPTVPGKSFDISLGGVGITADIFLERGQSVVIRFQLEEPIGTKPSRRACWDESPTRGPTRTATASASSSWRPIRESAQPAVGAKINNL